MRMLSIAVIAAALTLPAVHSQAQNLTIGARAAPSLDPHFMFIGTNFAYARHIYSTLTERDNMSRTRASLAESWKSIDPTTWEFKLRKNAKFHDGSAVTADDVVFSMNRIPNVPNNVQPYTGQLKTITAVEKKDDHTVVVKTSMPNPQLPAQFPLVFIVSKKASEGKGTVDFTTGVAAIGSGPYKVKRYLPGQELVLERFEDYWGEKPYWKNVTFKIMGNDAARTAALLAGDVDVIEFVPPSDVPRLKSAKGIAVHTGPSDRTIYLAPDQRNADKSGFVTDAAGNPLDKNPLKDARVRRAMAMAIDRDAMVRSVMGGLAAPANQLVPPGMLGYNKSLPPLKYDLAGAKKLLADAGYPNGFGLTVHCPSDRYMNDAKVCQAVGQMLARVGIKMQVVAQPGSVYFANLGKGEYSLPLIGWGSAGEATAVWTVLATTDKKRAIGIVNHNGYSNKAIDELVDKVLVEFDDAARGQLEQKVMQLAMEDMAIIPIHYQVALMASKSTLKVANNVNEYTLATNVMPAK